MDPLPAGGEVLLNVPLTLPKVRVPLMLRFACCDHGIARFERTRNGYVRHLIWPNPLR